MADTAIAQKRWEVENNVMEIDAAQDAVYRFDNAENQRQLQAKRWATEWVPDASGLPRNRIRRVISLPVLTTLRKFGYRPSP